MKEYTINIDALCNGTGYVDYSDNPVTGIIKGYYDNGVLEYSVSVENGIRQGIMHLYNTEGTIKYDIPFVDGVIHGDVTVYQDCELQNPLTFINGKVKYQERDISLHSQEVNLFDPTKDSGKHFEGFGNIWNAIYDNCDMLLKSIGEKVQHASLSLRTEDGNTIYLTWGNSEYIKLMFVLENNEDHYEIESFYPAVCGRDNKYMLECLYSWENKVEGEAIFDCRQGVEVCMLDTRYKQTRTKVPVGSSVNVSLGAIALKLEKHTRDSFSIDSGSLYLMQLCEHLHKSSDVSAFRNIEISMKGSRIFFPSGYSCEYEVQCPVLGVCEGEFDGLKFYIINTIVAGTNENEVPVNICVFEKVLNGYIPKKGDDVLGIIWLHGTVGEIETMPNAPYYTLIDYNTLTIATDGTCDDIKNRLKALNKEKYYLILECSNGQYVQTAFSDEGFWVEWRQGSFDKHYRLKEAVNIDEAAAIFKLFLDDNIEVLNRLSWGKIELKK